MEPHRVLCSAHARLDGDVITRVHGELHASFEPGASKTNAYLDAKSVLTRFRGAARDMPQSVEVRLTISKCSSSARRQSNVLSFHLILTSWPD